MDTKSPLYQLMGLRMNGIMNEITAQDEDYQSLLKRADECTDKLESLNLPEETRKLIDRYASECNAIGSRYGVLAYLLGFSDCRELVFDSDYPGKEALPSELLHAGLHPWN